MSDAGLVERERELRLLDESIRAAANAGGAFVVVEGPAGIEKTTLLAEVRRIGAAQGMTVLSAQGAALEREFGFGVVRQLFEVPMAGASGEVRRRVLAGAARLAAPIVAPAEVEPEAPAGRQPAIVHGLYWLTANLADSSPVILAVDDVHWRTRRRSSSSPTSPGGSKACRCSWSRQVLEYSTQCSVATTSDSIGIDSPSGPGSPIVVPIPFDIPGFESGAVEGLSASCRLTAHNANGASGFFGHLPARARVPRHGARRADRCVGDPRQHPGHGGLAAMCAELGHEFWSDEQRLVDTLSDPPSLQRIASSRTPTSSSSRPRVVAPCAPSIAGVADLARTRHRDLVVLLSS